jgi:hypothetical protein
MFHAFLFHVLKVNLVIDFGYSLLLAKPNKNLPQGFTLEENYVEFYCCFV